MSSEKNMNMINFCQ